jgi:hypothetical protein
MIKIDVVGFWVWIGITLGSLLYLSGISWSFAMMVVFTSEYVAWKIIRDIVFKVKA